MGRELSKRHKPAWREALRTASIARHGVDLCGQAWLLADPVLSGLQGLCGAHRGSSVLEAHANLTAPSAKSRTESQVGTDFALPLPGDDLGVVV